MKYNKDDLSNAVESNDLNLLQEIIQESYQDDDLIKLINTYDVDTNDRKLLHWLLLCHYSC